MSNSQEAVEVRAPFSGESRRLKNLNLSEIRLFDFRCLKPRLNPTYGLCSRRGGRPNTPLPVPSVAERGS